MLARTPALLTLAALALLSLAAVAAPEVETKALGPAQQLERNLELRAGDTVAWSLGVQPGNATVYFDIHSHDPANPRGVITHVRDNVTGQASGSFPVPNDGTFSWFVINSRAQSVTVTLSTEVNPPAAPPGSPVPGPGAALLALAALGAVLLVRPPRRPRTVRA